MEVQPELSLGFAPAVKIPRRSSSNSEGSGGGAGNKRKHFAWESHGSSLDLQLGDPLPLDWEQCLDLHSGRMYYQNRKTKNKSWDRPSSKEEQGTLNLELGISTTPDTFKSHTSGGHMVAVPCVNCHLLVMLCKSSPACPNCKFVQPSVAGMPKTPPRRRLETVKPLLETLSLLH
ncbi:WW domain containing protein [Zea mays]|uniref:WW domain containing protein n=1 Tax=Zea mays TaxID=4577 RepID=B6U8S2_MAIZE|nr:WW domain containing protein [Zea mays]ACG45755.1 WW domain containing protein [Zea mays]AQK58063.1 WW domain containing protein [Zea mays]|eukprot:NP_001152094.1 WW domain containing protein [Zea mays]